MAQEELVELVMAADELLVAEDGAVATVARNTAGGLEAAFALAVRGGMQPQRVGFDVNPLARRVDNAVVLRSLGQPTERFVHAAAAAWGQETPPPKPRWKRLFERSKKAGEARFSGLLVMREGDASAPTLLRLKLFCEGGELYLDVDAQTRRITLYEKDPEFRPALIRALLPLLPD